MNDTAKKDGHHSHPDDARSNLESPSSLLPMLISGLVLIVIGMVAVMFFPFG